MTDRRRKGSLAWYHNSKRESLVPRAKKREGIFGIKIGNTTRIINDLLVPVSLIELVKMEQQDTQYIIDYTNLKCVRRKVLREIKTELDIEALKKKIIESKKLDIIAYTKGKGTLGVVQRRKVKMQKRKAASSGVTRKGGSHGLRVPGKVVWTKPFSGKTGVSRRTIQGLENYGTENVKDTPCLRYYIKDAEVLLVKGGIPGPIGRPVFVSQSLRP